MYLVSESLAPVASWVFEAEILVLHHPTTISVNYQAVVHCGSIKQSAAIIGEKYTAFLLIFIHFKYIFQIFKKH
jgi:GTPase